MGKSKRNFRESSKAKAKVSPFKDYWERYNYYLLFLGIGILILGFYFMAQGPWDNPLSLSISPIVLLIAYIVILPLAILFRSSKKKDKGSNVSSQG